MSFIKSKRLYLLITFLFLTSLPGCGDDNPDYYSLGIQSLESGVSSEAISNLGQLLDNNPNHYQGKYALMLSHFQAAINSLDAYLETVSPFILPPEQVAPKLIHSKGE